MNDQLKAQFQTLLKNTLADLKATAKGEVSSVAQYAADRMKHLQTLVSDPHFPEAVAAERDAVMLRLGVEAVSSADAVDAQVAKIVETALQIGATAAATAISAA